MQQKATRPHCTGTSDGCGRIWNPPYGVGLIAGMVREKGEGG